MAVDEEVRLQDQLSTRALCAGVILRALRDYIEGDRDALLWFMDSDLDDVEPEEGTTTFARACANLELDPNSIRDKLRFMTWIDLEMMKGRLRRTKTLSRTELEGDDGELHSDRED